MSPFLPPLLACPDCGAALETGTGGRLTCPILIVYGDHDAAAIPPIPDRIARCRALRPDLQAHIIPDCGHWAMYAAPEAVNRLLLDFHGGC